jgi:hypothetical protein
MKNSKITVIYLLISLLALFSACKKGGDDSNPQPDPDPSTTFQKGDVLVGGIIQTVRNNTTASQACYWKNGNLTTLASPDIQTNVTGLLVSGNDLHINLNEINPDLSTTSKHWKNGQITPLPGLGGKIVKNDKDVFFVTTESGPNFKLWKNGAKIQDNVPSNMLFVQGNDVYYGGRIETKVEEGQPAYFIFEAAYWKNETRFKLTNKETQGMQVIWATDICVTGNDVHVIGEDGLNYPPQKIFYWKNGVEVNLNTDGEFITHLFSNGKDVYFFVYKLEGFLHKATLYKNGTPTNVIFNDSGTELFETTGLYVTKTDDIYVLGKRYENVDALMAGEGESSIWKNGTFTNLNTNGKNSCPTLIYIVE